MRRVERQKPQGQRLKRRRRTTTRRARAAMRGEAASQPQPWRWHGECPVRVLPRARCRLGRTAWPLSNTQRALMPSVRRAQPASVYRPRTPLTPPSFSSRRCRRRCEAGASTFAIWTIQLRSACLRVTSSFFHASRCDHHFTFRHGGVCRGSAPNPQRRAPNAAYRRPAPHRHHAIPSAACLGLLGRAVDVPDAAACPHPSGAAQGRKLTGGCSASA